MAKSLEEVQAATIDGIDTLMDGLTSGMLTPAQWREQMGELLLVGHTAAYMAGTGSAKMTPQALELIAERYNTQLDYLDRFANDIERGDIEADANRWRARARLYAAAMRASYSRGKTAGYRLPAYPGDGSTECLVNCKCEWRIVTRDREGDNADAYWRLGQAEHCPTCERRARQWNPLRIRNGEVING